MIHLLLPQFYGHGGIPRFNRNLTQSLSINEEKCLTLTLNDTPPMGFRRNKKRFIIAYLKHLFRYRPRIVIIGHLNLAPLALLGKFSGAKVVLILHGIEAWYDRGWLKFFFSCIDQFWAVSHYTQRKFSISNKVPCRRIKRIFNTLPADWSSKEISSRYLNYFLSVTRLDRAEGYKGIDTTLNAIATLENQLRSRGWQYIVLASGSDVERHRQLAIELGIDDLVRFLSSISDSELKQLYADCSFFILPSTGEGFGIVFLEAMAYRKACIGGADCGTEDVIEDGKTGFLVAQKASVITQKIRALIDQPDVCRQMGVAGYEKLQREFTFTHFQHCIQEYLAQCVE